MLFAFYMMYVANGALQAHGPFEDKRSCEIFREQIDQSFGGNGSKALKPACIGVPQSQQQAQQPQPRPQPPAAPAAPAPTDK